MYFELTPTKWLTQYVDACWIAENSSSNATQTTILPDGCVDIIVSFDNNASRQFVVGCMSVSDISNLEPFQKMFGIRFKPGYAAAFLGVALKEITDKTVSLNNIRNVSFNEFTPELLKSEPLLITSLVEKKLRPLLIEKKIDKIVCSTANFIKNTNGLKQLDELADMAGISRRHLERKFLDCVGITPKLFSRIIRFRRVDKMLKTISNGSPLAIALKCGYYDQAHFCKEYKEFYKTNLSAQKNLSHFYNTVSKF